MNYFNTEKSAEKLGLAVPTFRKFRREGLIKGAKPGKVWIHSEADLNEFYEKHRTKEANPADYLVNQRKG